MSGVKRVPSRRPTPPKRVTSRSPPRRDEESTVPSRVQSRERSRIVRSSSRSPTRRPAPSKRVASRRIDEGDEESTVPSRIQSRKRSRSRSPTRQLPSRRPTPRSDESPPPKPPKPQSLGSPRVDRKSEDEHSKSEILNFYKLVDYIHEVELGEYDRINHRRFDRLCKKAMRTIKIHSHHRQLVSYLIDKLTDISENIDLELNSPLKSIKDGLHKSAHLRITVHDVINDILLHEGTELAIPMLNLQTLFNHYLQFCIIQSLDEGLSFNGALYDMMLRFIFDMGHTYKVEVRLFSSKTSKHTQFGGKRA